MTTIALETAVLSNTSATLGDRIAAAAALWELIEECEAALKPFKDEVRAMAVAAGNPTMTINGTGMCQCKVVVPGASLKLREGLSVEGERAALGELFGTVFEVKLALRSTSPAVAATLPPAAQAHLANGHLPCGEHPTGEPQGALGRPRDISSCSESPFPYAQTRRY